MKAVFLGSISVLVDTSEVQRSAFNTSFAEAGLDWHWSRDEYSAMLAGSGGPTRIASFAKERNVVVDANALHIRKTEVFENKLRNGTLHIRPETAVVIEHARAHDLALAFVSGTSRASIVALLLGLGGVEALGLDLVTSQDDAAAAKPDPALYQFALKSLKLAPQDVLAIEDNRAGVDAAKAAGLLCLAYPNANTVGHDFSDVGAVQGWKTAFEG